MKPQKLTIAGPIRRPTELNEGDAYVDLPVYGDVAVYGGKAPMKGAVVRYYERTPLRWMKPGPDGKLVPK